MTLLFAALATVWVGAGCDTGNKTADNGSAGSAVTGSSDTGSKSARPATTGTGNKYTDGDIKIGLVASETGALLPWGVDCEKGVKLAVKQFNAAGGAQGHQVQLLIEDSGSKPEQGKSAAEKLISEGVLGVLGEVSSGITLQMGQSCFEKGVPDIAVGATKTTLTDMGNTMFRVCYTDAMQGPVMADFAYQQLGLKNVAIMTDRAQPYSIGLSKSFSDTFQKLGGKICTEQFYETGATDFKGQISQLKPYKPDGIFASGYFPEVGPMARQVKEEGLDVTMLGGDGWDSSQILKTGGAAIVGSYFCNHYNNHEDRPAVKSFLAAWKAEYPDTPVPATTMGALGYDAAMVMLNALKDDKSLDSAGLITAIDNTDNYHGVTGDITLKGNGGNPPKRAIVVKLSPTEQLFAKAYEPSDVTK